MKINKVYKDRSDTTSSYNRSCVYTLLDFKGKIVYKLTSWELSMKLIVYHKEDLTFRIQKLEDLKEDRLYEFEVLMPLVVHTPIRLDYSRVLITREKLDK